MRSLLYKRSIVLSVIGLGAISAMLWSISMPVRAAQSSPMAVVIYGNIYDFRSDHPDFGLSPGAGLEVAGLVDPVLGSGGRPVFLGNGSALADQAIDGDGEPIAPHLFWEYGGNGALALASTPTLVNSASMDIYDPSEPYGGSNVGPEPQVSTKSVMPTIPVPTGLPYQDTVDLNGNSSSTLSKSLECRVFRVRNGHVLTISGDVTLVVTDEFRLLNSSQVELLDGASLTVYTGGVVEIRNTSRLNMVSFDHTRVTFYNYGTEPFDVDNATMACATFINPNSEFLLENTSDVFGTVTAQSLRLENDCALHIADTVWDPAACYTQNDSQPATGSPDDGQISGPMSLAQWFSSAPGVNQFRSHQMFLGDTGSEYVTYSSDWDPINGELYGNEGDTANRGFAFAGESQFMYNDCSGQYIEIETAMDCWVFIDDELVIDLGGNTGRSRQRIVLDRLELDPGLHKLRLFIAHRQNTAMDLEVRTTLPLTRPRTVQTLASTLHD